MGGVWWWGCARQGRQAPELSASSFACIQEGRAGCRSSPRTSPLTSQATLNPEPHLSGAGAVLGDDPERAGGDASGADGGERVHQPLDDGVVQPRVGLCCGDGEQGAGTFE